MASRSIEFSNPNLHAGWRGGQPVYVVFSLTMAKSLFDNFERPVAICVAPPLSAVAETYEHAIAFFSDDEVISSVGKAVFDLNIAP
jgi:hypothetical protein